VTDAEMLLFINDSEVPDFANLICFARAAMGFRLQDIDLIRAAKPCPRICRGLGRMQARQRPNFYGKPAETPPKALIIAVGASKVG